MDFDPQNLVRLFPQSLPDELFASRPSRYHWSVGGKSTEETAALLFGHIPGRLTQIIPWHLWPLSRRLPGNSQQHLNRMLHRNTLYPIYSLFYDLDYTDLENPDADIYLPLPRRTYSLPDTKICLSCVRDDFNEVGIPYLHRSHQIPGVRVCHRHALPLFDRCPYCQCPFETYNDLFSVPWRPCKCGRMLHDIQNPQSTVEADNPAVKYADFTHALLNQASFSVKPQEISEVYRYRLRQLGLERGKLISHRSTMQAIEDYYGKEELAFLDTAYRDGSKQGWLRLIHSSIKPQEVPISRHLLLANFLFETAEEFLAQLKNAQRCLSHTHDQLLPETWRSQGLSNAATQNTRIEKYVKKVLQIKAEHPHFTLNDLWKKLPGTLEKLVKQAPEEFEKLQEKLSNSPITRATNHKTIHVSSKDTEVDRANSDLLKQTVTQIYASTQKPRRATKTEIIRSAKLAPRYINPERYSLSAQVVESYTESSWHYWARRYIWASVQADSQAGTSEILKLSGINRYHFREFVPVFSNLKVPTHLREGQIIAILGSYGFNLKWHGPCPDKVVVGGGRAYQRKKSALEQRSPGRIKKQSPHRKKTATLNARTVGKKARRQ